MAKKKNSRQKHQKDVGDPNTSDDEGNFTNNKGCPHTSRAINLMKIKKYLRANPNIENCMSCLKLPSKDSQDSDIPDSEEVWLCLQCGHCGCGRNAPLQHAITHHKTPRSDSHAIVLNTTSMCIWCYECDDEIQHRTSRIIRECVDLVKKTSTAKRPSVYMNGTVSEVARNNSVNDSMMKSVIEPERISTVLESKNISEESIKVQPHKNSKKPEQNMCKSYIKGLRNLGNTCFFNAVMQNLSQTPWLLNELERRAEKSYNWEIPFPVNEDKDLNTIDEGIKPLKISLGDCYPLAQATLSLLKQMKSNSQTRKGEVVNPGNLFEQICKKSPQFRGFQQQDSHELLRHLLDGVRNEEIRRQKRGILKTLNMEKVDRNSVDEETRQTIKAYGVYASHTLIEKIFGGQLLSTVLCEECKMSSQVFEPFMDLSLPLAEEKPMRANKGHKHEVTEDYGIQKLSRAKELDTKLSKHQERKMKQQARKTAKKQAKLSKMKSSSPVLNEEPSDGNGETSSEIVDAEQKTESNNELSDADIEDNEDSESVCCKFPAVAPEKEVKVNGNCSDEGVCEDGMNCAQEMDDRLQELCSQITDIRIRRDSDRQENFLDSLDGHTNCGRNEENEACHNKSDLDSNHAESERWMHSQPDQLKKEWLLKSLTTVKPRYQPSAHECSVNSCLNQFTAPELLTGSNKFRCENCTSLKQEATGSMSEIVYSNASKRLLIFSPPAVLTLHLKRFQQTGMSLRKLNLFVEFPRVLDLAPYCSSVCLKLPHMAGVKDEILYSLYGIVQHSGRLTSGHYTAFVRASKNHLNSAFLNNWPMGQCSLDQLLEKIRKVKTHFNETVNDISNEGKHLWYYVSDGHFNEVSEAEVFKCQAYILFYERIK